LRIDGRLQVQPVLSLPTHLTALRLKGWQLFTRQQLFETLDLESTPSDTLVSGGATMKIGEVSEKYEISSDTLRYYERIGLLPSVNRTDSGIRDYGELDLMRVSFIKCMRSAGLPIEVLIQYFELVQRGDETIEARKEILIEQREQLRPE
jgi:DNA-binding transcriptional MerR regulator